MTWARQQIAPDSGSKALLLLLAEIANDQGETWRSQQYLADILQVHRTTVNANLRKLREVGLITAQERYWEDTHKRRSNYIILQLDQSFTTQENPCSETLHGTEEPCSSTLQTHVAFSPEPCSVTLQHVNNKQTTKQTTSLSVADAPQAEALIPLPEEKHVASKQYVAKKLYDASKGALHYQGMMEIAGWALKSYADLSPEDVGKAMWAIYQRGRPVTKQALGQALQGFSNSRGAVERNMVVGERMMENLRRQSETLGVLEQ